MDGWAVVPERGHGAYSQAQREAAFLVYCGAGAGSLRQTARLTGIHRETLQAWAKHDQWRARLDGAVAETGALATALDVVHALFPTLTRVMADRWLKILSDDRGNQNAQAKLIEFTAGLNRMVVPKQTVSLGVTATVSAPSAPLAELLRSAASDPALAPYLDPPSPPPPPLPPQGFTSEQACVGVGVPDPSSRQSHAEPGIGDILDAVYEERG